MLPLPGTTVLPGDVATKAGFAVTPGCPGGGFTTTLYGGVPFWITNEKGPGQVPPTLAAVTENEPGLMLTFGAAGGGTGGAPVPTKLWKVAVVVRPAASVMIRVSGFTHWSLLLITLKNPPAALTGTFCRITPRGGVAATW